MIDERHSIVNNSISDINRRLNDLTNSLKKQKDNVCVDGIKSSSDTKLPTEVLNEFTDKHVNVLSASTSVGTETDSPSNNVKPKFSIKEPETFESAIHDFDLESWIKRVDHFAKVVWIRTTDNE